MPIRRRWSRHQAYVQITKEAATWGPWLERLEQWGRYNLWRAAEKLRPVRLREGFDAEIVGIPTYHCNQPGTEK